MKIIYIYIFVSQSSRPYSVPYQKLLDMEGQYTRLVHIILLLATNANMVTDLSAITPDDVVLIKNGQDNSRHVKV